MVREKILIKILGIVQGVGFRPFIHKLAEELRLNGWVRNSIYGVEILAEGEKESLQIFLNRIKEEHPRAASIFEMNIEKIDDKEKISGFKVAASSSRGIPNIMLPPDLAMCDKCRGELFSPSNRRFGYPFINCTECGPRFSIIEDVPYDRERTTMKKFAMCAECLKEYTSIRNRRYHAEATCCAVCGPTVWLATEGRTVGGEQAISEAVKLLREGKIVAIKGLGGFHLACLPAPSAVKRLRLLKSRPSKPFALMAFSVEEIEKFCHVSEKEKNMLESSVSPIVLLKKKNSHFDFVSPVNNYLGFMLPYTPLHALILKEVSPLIMTSGNRADEPICKENREAQSSLKEIADAFLFHNRDIFQRVDDSIVGFHKKGYIVFRRARGFVPKPLKAEGVPEGVIGMGADLKATFAVSRKGWVFPSQYLGDLEIVENQEFLKESFSKFIKVFRIAPKVFVVDMHPEYFSRQIGMELAGEWDATVFEVQHHLAHALSVMLEKKLDRAFAVVWDGTGYGMDGVLWGSEFFVIKQDYFERVAHFEEFELPGGEAAIRQPWRLAFSLLPESRFLFKEKEFVKVPGPAACGAARLFDAVSAMLGLCQEQTFEGEAPQRLQKAAERCSAKEVVPYSWEASGGKINVRKILEQVLRDIQRNRPIEEIAYRFHVTMADIILKIASNFLPLPVVLSGGVFQNLLLDNILIERASDKLKLHFPEALSPNDSSVCVGQIEAFKRGMAKPLNRGG